MSKYDVVRRHEQMPEGAVTTKAADPVGTLTTVSGKSKINYKYLSDITPNLGTVLGGTLHIGKPNRRYIKLTDDPFTHMEIVAATGKRVLFVNADAEREDDITIGLGSPDRTGQPEFRIYPDGTIEVDSITIKTPGTFSQTLLRSDYIWAGTGAWGTTGVGHRIDGFWGYNNSVQQFKVDIYGGGFRVGANEEVVMDEDGMWVDCQPDEGLADYSSNAQGHRFVESTGSSIYAGMTGTVNAAEDEYSLHQWSKQPTPTDTAYTNLFAFNSDESEYGLIQMKMGPGDYESVEFDIKHLVNFQTATVSVREELNVGTVIYTPRIDVASQLIVGYWGVPPVLEPSHFAPYYSLDEGRCWFYYRAGTDIFRIELEAVT